MATKTLTTENTEYGRLAKIGLPMPKHPETYQPATFGIYKDGKVDIFWNAVVISKWGDPNYVAPPKFDLHDVLVALDEDGNELGRYEIVYRMDTVALVNPNQEYTVQAA